MEDNIKVFFLPQSLYLDTKLMSFIFIFDRLS